MQINSRASQYYPVVIDSRNNSNKLPTVYSDKTAVAPYVSQQRADNTSVVLAAERSNDNQQSRFVREFSSVERDFSQAGLQQQSLPRSVQQYVSVAAMSSDDSQGGSLIDEIV